MIRIKEAVKRHNERTGERIKVIDVGKRLWPDSSPLTQKESIYKLANGNRAGVRLEHVRKICDMLGCDPNFLFGFD